MIKNILSLATLGMALCAHAYAAQTPCAVFIPTCTQFIPTCTQFMPTGTQLVVTGTDVVTTPTNLGFIEAMNADLQSFIQALSCDKQLFHAWNNALIQLLGSLAQYQQQHTCGLNQLRELINELKQVIANQELQGQGYAQTIAALTAQLAALQQQTDQEIIALQQQLDNTTRELDILEDEYSNFVDASFAHTQGLYAMLQLAKQEYAGLIVERTQFLNSLQALTTALESNAQGMNNELYDLIRSITGQPSQAV